MDKKKVDIERKRVLFMVASKKRIALKLEEINNFFILELLIRGFFFYMSKTDFENKEKKKNYNNKRKKDYLKFYV